MLLVEIFYCAFFVTTLAVIWFKTDWILHYCQLFGLLKSFQINFLNFIAKESDSYLPEYIYQQSKKSSNKFYKFIGKLVSCPFCVLFWLALGCSLFYGTLLLVCPVYILSLLLFLGIKNLS
jgi:hypothetical protein